MGGKARYSRKNPRPFLSTAEIEKVSALMSENVYAIQYKHKKDGVDYDHDFGKGAHLQALPDGSLRIYHPTRKLWKDFR